MDTFGAIALSLSSVGGSELKRSGNQKYAYYLFESAFIWVFISIIFPILFGRIIRGPFLEISFVGFLMLLAAQFPLAFYLNRCQKTSTSQQVSANES
jgi:hypothetical protein